MLRRLSPLIATLLAMLLDTAVIPILYHGTYTFPLTLVIVLCIGLLLAGFAAFLTTLYLIVQAWRRRRERSPRYSMVQVIGTTLLTVFLLRFSVGLAAACVAQYDLMGDLYGNLTWYERAAGV